MSRSARYALRAAFSLCVVAQIASCTGDDPKLTSSNADAGIDGEGGIDSGGPIGADGGSDATSASDASSDAFEAGPSGPNYKVALTVGKTIPAPTGTNDGGRGTAALTYYADGGIFCGRVIYSGLTSPGSPTVAHVHRGDASATGNIVTEVVITSVGAGQMKVRGTLPVSDVAALDTQLLYLDLHTQTNGGGEIRGQIEPAPEDPTVEDCD